MKIKNNNVQRAEKQILLKALFYDCDTILNLISLTLE